MRRVTKMGEQRIALVTGGNRGIGLEVCRQLAGLHMRVILGSRDETKGVAAAKQLATAGLSVEARQLDVASVQSIRECMNWVRRDVGRLDILVNAVDPGWVQTAMGGRGASRTVEKGAETVVWLATLPDSGPTGAFFRDRKPIAW